MPRDAFALKIQGNAPEKFRDFRETGLTSGMNRVACIEKENRTKEKDLAEYAHIQRNFFMYRSAFVKNR